MTNPEIELSASTQQAMTKKAAEKKAELAKKMHEDMQRFMSPGQRTALARIDTITRKAPDGMHRLGVLTEIAEPVACMFGKEGETFFMSGEIWANFVNGVGKLLDQSGSMRVVLQSWPQENPSMALDLDSATTAQVISGWTIESTGDMRPMRVDALRALIPFRTDIDMSYRKK